MIEPVYEDELPPDMTDAEYAEWFTRSEVVDGVRVSSKIKALLRLQAILRRELATVDEEVNSLLDAKAASLR